MAKRTRLPSDHNQRAKAIVDLATHEEPFDPYEGKDPAAVESGRVGGQIGGKARAKKLPSKRRSEIARKAAEARWRQVEGE